MFECQSIVQRETICAEEQIMQSKNIEIRAYNEDEEKLLQVVEEKMRLEDEIERLKKENDELRADNFAMKVLLRIEKIDRIIDKL